MTVSVLACLIANGKSTDQLNLLSTFFTQFGDSLETIAAGNEICKNNSGNNNEANT